MKKLTRSMLALLLSVITVLYSVVPAYATDTAPVQPETYSTTANSGVRHVICTTLAGTGAASYYTGDYTYENLSELSSDRLLDTLRTLMTSTHKTITSYSNCRDYANKTDCENADGTTIVTLYTSYKSNFGQYNNGSGWNREHVWPKSLGGFNQDGAGADLHHIRPTENRTNSQRGNKLYGNVNGGTNSTGNMSGLVGGSYSGYFEPLDNVKGDVARICLYVYVRWGKEYSMCSRITNVFQSIDVLLEWCELDPVDTWEMGRNEVVGKIQGNRNVFIDYPELAWTLFDREVPENMTTPSSGMSEGSGSVTPDNPTDTPDEPGNENNGPCTHENVTVVNKIDSCTDFGYSGDQMCADCDKLLLKGTKLPPYGHEYSEEVIVEATDSEAGLIKKTCTKCGIEEIVTAPKLQPDTPDNNLTVIIAVAVSAIAVAAATVTIAVMVKKKKTSKAQDGKAQQSKAQESKAQESKAQESETQENKAQENKAQSE